MKSRQLPCVTDQIQSESDVTDNSFRLLLLPLFIGGTECTVGSGNSFQIALWIWKAASGESGVIYGRKY